MSELHWGERPEDDDLLQRADLVILPDGELQGLRSMVHRLHVDGHIVETGGGSAQHIARLPGTQEAV